MTDEALEAALRNEMPEDDPDHPLSLLGTWTLMIAEDYGIELPPRLTLSYCASFLERTLPRLAQDDEQDWPLFAREIRRCRSHIESVLRDSLTPERGAPCPICTAPAPRLNLERGHWCEDAECERIHWPEDADRYVCPRDRAHTWEDDDYRKWVADVYEANRGAAS